MFFATTSPKRRMAAALQGLGMLGAPFQVHSPEIGERAPAERPPELIQATVMAPAAPEVRTADQWAEAERKAAQQYTDEQRRVADVDARKAVQVQRAAADAERMRISAERKAEAARAAVAEAERVYNQQRSEERARAMQEQAVADQSDRKAAQVKRAAQEAEHLKVAADRRAAADAQRKVAEAVAAEAAAADQGSDREGSAFTDDGPGSNRTGRNYDDYGGPGSNRGGSDSSFAEGKTGEGETIVTTLAKAVAAPADWFSSLPMPVKVIGGLGLGYFALKALKVIK